MPYPVDLASTRGVPGQVFRSRRCDHIDGKEQDMNMKVILLTGATDGIGLETARRLVAHEHHHRVLVHGRNASKLKRVADELNSITTGDNPVETYCFDLSQMSSVRRFTESIKAKHSHLDVIINNAGVFKTPNPRTDEGLDTRFAVNTVAPYLLTRDLWELMDPNSRVVNVSSAAQAKVSLTALSGAIPVANDSQAYAQSKLAIIQWSNHMAKKSKGPIIVSVNPASLLGSKMVKDAYGIAGGDLSIGADILVRAATSEEFGPSASGKYYDNDNRCFASPHPDAKDAKKNSAIVDAMEEILEGLGLN